LDRLVGKRPELVQLSEIYRLEQGAYLRWVKPTLDRVCGVVALIVLAPVILTVGVLVYMHMGSPVLLRQRRVGQFGSEFELYKFRTMEPDRRLRSSPYLAEDRRRTHKSPDDPRLTSFGRKLRATRLDELPQFINVAKGEMSLVGPRPELSDVVVTYEPWQHRRHAVKPGITGLWQVAGETQLLKDCTRMELPYLEQVSLFTDARIILRTIPIMFRRKGI
jgi:lipopolysaccharide/colanic/teichoic acid biosynthesis glycosyltransferase